MDVTMIGLQNAGKSSLLRVLAVCPPSPSFAGAKVLIMCRVGNSRSSKSLGKGLLSLPVVSRLMFQFDPDHRVQYQACAEGPCDLEMVC